MTNEEIKTTKYQTLEFAEMEKNVMVPKNLIVLVLLTTGAGIDNKFFKNIQQQEEKEEKSEDKSEDNLVLNAMIGLKKRKGSKYYPDNFLKDIIKMYLKSDVNSSEKIDIDKLVIQLQKVLQFYNQFRSEEFEKIYSNLRTFLSPETIQYLDQVSSIVPLYQVFTNNAFLTFSFICYDATAYHCHCYTME